MRTIAIRCIQAITLMLGFGTLLAVVEAAAGDTKHAYTEMRIKIGTKTLTATLEENPTAAAFKTMLPMTIKMRELNGNEKYFDLPRDLPTKASKPGTIKTGDLMIYGDKILVLFYKSFPTSYSYTQLGRVNDIAGLAAAVGSGDAEITYELVEAKNKR